MELCLLAGDTAPFIIMSILIMGVLTFSNFLSGNGGLETLFSMPAMALTIFLAWTAWAVSFVFIIFRVTSSSHLIRPLLGLKPVPFEPNHYCLIDSTIVMSMTAFGVLLVLACFMLMRSSWRSQEFDLSAYMGNANRGQHNS